MERRTINVAQAQVGPLPAQAAGGGPELGFYLLVDGGAEWLPLGHRPAAQVWLEATSDDLEAVLGINGAPLYEGYAPKAIPLPEGAGWHGPFYVADLQDIKVRRADLSATPASCLVRFTALPPPAHEIPISASGLEETTPFLLGDGQFATLATLQDYIEENITLEEE